MRQLATLLRKEKYLLDVPTTHFFWMCIEAEGAAAVDTISVFVLEVLVHDTNTCMM